MLPSLFVDALGRLIARLSTPQLGVPYSYGWSIIVLTMLVKVALLPVTIKQVQSSLAMQELKPQARGRCSRRASCGHSLGLHP